MLLAVHAFFPWLTNLPRVCFKPPRSAYQHHHSYWAKLSISIATSWFLVGITMTEVRESSPETAAFDEDYFQWASRLNEVTSRYANQKRAAEAELEQARETLQDGIRKLQDEYQERVQKLKAIAKEQQQAIRRELEFHIDDLHLLRLTDEVSTKGTSV